MKKEKLTMETMKYKIIFGLTLVSVMLFAACDDIINMPEIQTPIENSYGRISISLTNEEDQPQAAMLNIARTIKPSTEFDKYEYTFTKEGETTGTVKEPDTEGFFTMEVGNYTVTVKAYVGSEGAYTLVANGTSSEFAVNHGNNDPVEVLLTAVNTAAQGQLNYTITYPQGAEADITLQTYPAMNGITLNPVILTEENGKTGTLYLNTGSYLLSVLVNKDGFYGGISEAIHIESSLTTVFIKNFEDTDLFAVRIPLSIDYNISGTGTFIYNGNPREVTVEPKPNADVSSGATNVYYEGISNTLYSKSTTAPSDIGLYMITFDVAETTGWSAATGLPAGTLTISSPDNLSPSVDDYNITGTGTFTYNGNPRTVTITPKDGASPGTISNIRYNNLTTPPVNAGTYTVTFDVAAVTFGIPEEADWNGATGLIAGTIIIEKAPGETANTPLLSSRSHNSIRAYSNNLDNGQTIEFAINTTNTVPTSGWQPHSTVTPYNFAFYDYLTASTTYYIFARSAENNNYLTGPASTPLQVTTRHSYYINATGSSDPKVNTTSLTFVFSGNPGTLNVSDIHISGYALIGNNATITGSDNRRVLSPIITTGTGNAEITITHPDIETTTKDRYVYGHIFEGLYAKAPPVLPTDTSVNLDFTSGSTIIDRAFNYINNNPGTYTLMLDSDVGVAGHYVDDINAVRHLKANNAKLTILGIDEERKISLTSSGSIFTVGRTGITGIELTIGNNISLLGGAITSAKTVNVQNEAILILKDNAVVYGNSNGYAGAIEIIDNGTLIIQDNAKVFYSVDNGNIIMSGNAIINGRIRNTGSISMSENATIIGNIETAAGSLSVLSEGRIITMIGNASITGGIATSGAYAQNLTLNMSDNTSVLGDIGWTSIYQLGARNNFIINMQNNSSITGIIEIGNNSNFTMQDTASVTGRVLVYDNSNFTMKNNSKVINSNSNGVYFGGNNSVFTMSGYASVSNHNRGVYIEGNNNSFIMEGHATVSNNSTTGNGGGVCIIPGNNSAANFIMRDNSTVSGNTATASGGGVYISNTALIMQGGTIYGLNANPATLSNTATSGSTLFITNSSTAKYGDGEDILLNTDRTDYTITGRE